MLMDMCLPNYDIYQGILAPDCFKSHINSLCLDFFQKKFCLACGLKFTLSSVTSFLPDNLSGLKSHSVLFTKNTIAERSRDL